MANNDPDWLTHHLSAMKMGTEDDDRRTNNLRAEYLALHARIDQLTLELGDDVPEVMCKGGCGSELKVDWTCDHCK